ncbi:MAG: efflux RND transporter permease subunit [Phycisphaerales bacterium]|nr:efflux RND transporter permease subunit [Phycisphaerales bacterium]
MLAFVIDWSLRNRLLVIVGTIGVIIAGATALMRLPIDAFPDTTPVMVQVNTVAPALSPIEIEELVTAPIERTLAGLPRVREMRSVSKFGFGQVNIVFDDGMSVYLARQVIAERLAVLELPDGVSRPEMGPISTGLGETLHYSVQSESRGLDELTTLHDYEIRPQLQSVPGVAEVNTWGGLRQQYEVLIDPDRLVAFDLTMDELTQALRENNLTVGGGSISEGGELHLVRGLALTTSEQQIGDIVVTARHGSPIRVRDLATVRMGHEIRRGAVTANGRGEVVLGLAFLLMGENPHEVTQRLEARLDEIRRTLPPDVKIDILLERSELVEHVIQTVKTNLLEGALLVVAVLFIFLGNLRAGLIVALAIPMSMLVSFSAMLQVGIAASLLSLGAIDFGLVVDSSVILVENSVRRLALAPSANPREVIRDATLEVRRPTMFGELIIMSVYLPILLLEGVEGKLFRPMALTVIFALASSLVFSVTLTPVLASFALRAPRRAAKPHESDTFIVRLLQTLYRPALRFALTYRRTTILLCGAALAAGGFLAVRLGAEFVPRLSEGAIAINAVRLSGIALEESVRLNTQMEKLLHEKFPDEIRDVWSRAGSAQIATDPMGLEVTDIFITLQPRERWKKAQTQDRLVDLIDRELSTFPGQNLVYSQPIEMRVNEMLAGVRTDVGVKIFGDDLEQLRAAATRVRAILESIPGAADVSIEQITGLPMLDIQVDQDAIARLGVPARHVLEVVEAVGGIAVGHVRQGARRFELMVRLGEQFRGDPGRIGHVLVTTASGERIPLSRLATLRQLEGPATINRESQKRRVIVQANVRGRDLGSFVAEAQRRVQADLSLPPGYFTQFGGQFEHLMRASQRLTIIIPITLAIIMLLLYMSTGSLRDSLIVFTGAPFAAVGGVAALALLGLPFTISAGIGFIAVSGVSVLNGLVLVATIRQRLEAGVSVDEAIEQTRLMRLRPILMTALVAALGFVPMALNTGIGAEVQRPLAVVVIGGVIADNLLTLVALPALYSLVGKRSGGHNSATTTR